MVLDDRHIEYLQQVNLGNIRLWRAPGDDSSRYINSDWAGGRKTVDQIVAASMKALGLTRIVSERGDLKVVLTEKGELVLIEEDEAWA